MQSGVVVKMSGVHPPPDRLRLRIVEMAEKSSRNGSGNRGTRNPSTPLPMTSPRSNIDMSKLEDLRNAEREIKGEVYRPKVVTRVGQSKERINLEVPKPRQEQQSLSPYHRVVVLDASCHNNNNENNNNNNNNAYTNNSSSVSNKDRASARLLRRFRQRRLQDGNEKVEVTNANEGLYDKILPSQYRAFTAVEPSKRFRAASGTVVERSMIKENVYRANNVHSTTPEEEAETLSLSPTTHFPSNESAQAKKMGRVDTNKITSEERYGQTNSASSRQEPKSTLITRDKQGNPNRLSELRGNALPTPPPRHSSNRKPGLFSASLDAFRRRLRQTANKYSNRLNDENVDRTEEYVIRPEPQVKKAVGVDPQSQTKHRIQFPRFEPQLHISQQRPASETRRIDQKLRQQHLQNVHGNDDNGKNQVHPEREVYTLIENNNQAQQNNTRKDSGKCNVDVNNNESANMNKTLNFKKHGAENSKNNENSKTKDAARKSSIYTIISNNNGLNQMKSQNYPGIKDLQPDGNDESTDLDSDTLPCVTPMKQPVPKVKTYVLMNTSKSLNGTQPSLVAPQAPARKVAPLTEHNMRLHESLLAMYERRAQRMARYQKRHRALQLQQEQELQQQQQQQQNQNEPTQVRKERPQTQQRHQNQIVKENVGDHDGDSANSEESASTKRIRKWIDDVAEQFVFPVQEENIEMPVNYLAQTDFAVESAIQFENPLSSRGVVCF